MARVGGGVYNKNGTIGGLPTKVSGVKAQGPAPKGHNATGKGLPSNSAGAAKHGENLAKQNDGNAG